MCFLSKCSITILLYLNYKIYFTSSHMQSLQKCNCCHPITICYLSPRHKPLLSSHKYAFVLNDEILVKIKRKALLAVIELVKSFSIPQNCCYLPGLICIIEDTNSTCWLLNQILISSLQSLEIEYSHATKHQSYINIEDFVTSST